MAFPSIHEIASAFFDLLYPQICAGCGKELAQSDTPICPDCFHRLRPFTPPLCPRCGAPLHQPLAPGIKQCRYCPDTPHFFDRLHSVYSYKDQIVKNLIHSLKFDYQTRLAIPLSKMLLDGFLYHYAREPLDAIVPVPLHKSRYREREFNQAALLSQGIAEKTNLPIREDIVFRIRRTPPQTALQPQQRIKNLEGAFVPESVNAARGLRVLIIDDVMTTGATINAVSSALRQAGAQTIYGLTLALTIDRPASGSHAVSE